MADLRRRIASQMAALIDGPAFGCSASAVAAIYASTGRRVSEGTLTKRKEGTTVGWPIDEVAALEDASGFYGATDILHRRRAHKAADVGGSMVMHAGAINKESSEAVSAILALLESKCPAGGAKALVEIDEAIEVLRRARGRIEAEQ